MLEQILEFISSESSIALLGVIVGSLIIIIRDAWVSFCTRKSERSYAAIRLIAILNEYADKCVDVVQDDGTSHGQPAGRTSDGQEYYVAQTSLPEPLDYPEDISWRSLPQGLMHRVLALSSKARFTNRDIEKIYEFVADFPEYEEFFKARQKGYAILGLSSLKISAELEKYEPRDRDKTVIEDNWNLGDVFHRKLDDFKKDEDAQAKLKKERAESGDDPFFQFGDRDVTK